MRCVLVHVFRLFLDLLHRLVLGDNLLVELLEELGKLNQRLFDALDVIVTRAHSTQNAVGLSAAVGFELKKD